MALVMESTLPELGLLPAQVCESAGGLLMMLQEHTGPQGEYYTRVFFDMAQAEALAETILAVAKAARARR